MSADLLRTLHCMSCGLLLQSDPPSKITVMGCPREHCPCVEAGAVEAAREREAVQATREMGA